MFLLFHKQLQGTLTLGLFNGYYRYKQESIPTGCIPPASMDITRCQYWWEGIPGISIPWYSHPLVIPIPPLWYTYPSPPVHPQKGPGIRHTHPLPPDRMTDTCENITLPQLRWRAVNIIKDRWIHYRLGWHFQSTLLAKDIDPRYSFPFCQWSLLVEISHNMSWIILLSNSINSFIREAPYCLNHKECRVNTRTGRGWGT